MMPLPHAARALPAFLLMAVALAGGGGPVVSPLPTLVVDTRLLGVVPPAPVTVPAGAAEILGFFPAYSELRLPPGPVLPPSRAQREFFGNRGVVVAVHSVADLLAPAPGYTRRAEVRREVGTLRAVVAGTLDPRRLTVRVGSEALGRLHLPYLFDPFTWPWAAGAVRRVELPGGLRGVRYLAVRAADVGFLPAEATEYVFQGLSADGRFYVTLTAPCLPVGGPPRRPRGRSAAEAAYHADARTLQRQLDANDAAPAVRLLDRVVASLRLR